jgi:hypothetical protein
MDDHNTALGYVPILVRDFGDLGTQERTLTLNVRRGEGGAGLVVCLQR